MNDLPDLAPVETFIPTAYAMLEEIEAQIQQKLKQLEIERLRYVAPYIRNLDVDREGYEEWERIRKEREVQVVEEVPEVRHFLPEPEELKWLDARDRARINFFQKADKKWGKP